MIFISRLYLDHYLHPWNCDIKFLDKDHRINENPEPGYYFVCFLFSLPSIFSHSVQPVPPKATFETHRSFMVFTVSRRSHLKFSAHVCFMQDLDTRARPGLQCCWWCVWKSYDPHARIAFKNCSQSSSWGKFYSQRQQSVRFLSRHCLWRPAA